MDHGPVHDIATGPPGTFYNCSNPNFILAGHIVERMTGTDFTSYMEDKVWKPTSPSGIRVLLRPGNGQAALLQAGAEQVDTEPLPCVTQALGRGSMQADTV